MDEQRHCKHHGCRCMDVRGDGYCSEACAQGRSEGGRCGCGHPGCTGGIR